MPRSGIAVARKVRGPLAVEVVKNLVLPGRVVERRTRTLLRQDAAANVEDVPDRGKEASRLLLLLLLLPPLLLLLQLDLRLAVIVRDLNTLGKKREWRWLFALR